MLGMGRHRLLPSRRFYVGEHDDAHPGDVEEYDQPLRRGLDLEAPVATKEQDGGFPSRVSSCKALVGAASVIRCA